MCFPDDGSFHWRDWAAVEHIIRYYVAIGIREAGPERSVEATFFVEDDMTELVVEEIARELKRDVRVQIFGNRSGVENLFKYSQEQGGWANGYFIVDLDDRRSKHSDKANFIQLDRYCMENYFLDPDICAAVLGKTVEQVRVSIFEIVINKRGAITKGSRYREFFVDKLNSDGDLDTFLAYVEAKVVLKEFLDGSGMKKNDFVKKYIRHSHSVSAMRQTLPDQLVELVQTIPVRV